jgi:hypothetical protein
VLREHKISEMKVVLPRLRVNFQRRMLLGTLAATDKAPKLRYRAPAVPTNISESFTHTMTSLMRVIVYIYQEPQQLQKDD